MAGLVSGTTDRESVMICTCLIIAQSTVIYSYPLTYLSFHPRMPDKDGCHWGKPGNSRCPARCGAAIRKSGEISSTGSEYQLYIRYASPSTVTQFCQLLIKQSQ